MKRILIITSILFCIISCEKESSIINDSHYKISKYSIGDVTFEYSYNANGNLSQIIFSNGAITNYEHSDTLITIETIDKDANLVKKGYIRKNENGFASYSYQYDLLNGDTTYTEYFYSPDYELIKRTMIREQERIIDSYSWENGNIQYHNRFHSVNGKYEENTTRFMVYDESIANVNFEMRGLNLFGKSS